MIVGFGPIDPGCEVLRLEFVARDLGHTVEIGTVQRQAVIARDQTVGFVEIAAQFVDIGGFAGIIAGRHDAAAEPALGVFESADIIALPAVQANRHGLQYVQGGVGVDAKVV